MSSDDLIAWIMIWTLLFTAGYAVAHAISIYFKCEICQKYTTNKIYYTGGITGIKKRRICINCEKYEEGEF